MNKTFKAFIINENKQAKISRIKISDLMEGNVLVKVHYTSFNYKDGLAILNKAPIIKRYPMIPGVDFQVRWFNLVIKSLNKEIK